MAVAYTLSLSPVFLLENSSNSRDKVRVLKHSGLCFPCDRSVLVHPFFCGSLSEDRWRFSCSHHEDSSSKFLKPDENISKELVDAKVDQQSNVNTNSNLAKVMLLWIASFWLLGTWIIPFLAHITGFRKESLTYRGQAMYSLVTDVVEALAGFAILRQCLAKFRPLSHDWFRVSLGGEWHIDVGLGCLTFPLINHLSQVNLNILQQFPSTHVEVSNVGRSIVTKDPVATALYLVVVSVCSPIQEEIVFHGFLLPSLTKYMPLWCSILASSVALALAHFSMQRMLPLIFLGLVMGTIFAFSRNLFTPCCIAYGMHLSL